MSFLVIASANTAGGKVTKITNTDTGNAYAFPVGTIAEAIPGADATHYSLKLEHPQLSITMAIADITTIAGGAPAGNAIATDFSSLVAVLP